MLDVYLFFKTLQKHTFKRRGDRHPKFAENTTQAVANRGLPAPMSRSRQPPTDSRYTLNEKRDMLLPWRHTGRYLTDLGISVAQSHG